MPSSRTAASASVWRVYSIPGSAQPRIELIVLQPIDIWLTREPVPGRLVRKMKCSQHSRAASSQGQLRNRGGAGSEEGNYERLALEDDSHLVQEGSLGEGFLKQCRDVFEHPMLTN
jgi:hypothetical protein